MTGIVCSHCRGTGLMPEIKWVNTGAPLRDRRCSHCGGRLLFRELSEDAAARTGLRPDRTWREYRWDCSCHGETRPNPADGWMPVEDE